MVTKCVWKETEFSKLKLSVQKYQPKFLGSCGVILGQVNLPEVPLDANKKEAKHSLYVQKSKKGLFFYVCKKATLLSLHAEEKCYGFLFKYTYTLEQKFDKQA